MLLYATPKTPEDFEVIIDEPGLAVVRHNGVIAAQVNSPVDLSELYFRLAAEGYTMAEAIAYEDGVIELQLRPLGCLDDLDVVIQEAKVEIAALQQEKERSLAYA